MKAALRFGIFLLAPILLTGCLVFSLNPWFEKEDRMLDERLLGRWTSEGSGESHEVWDFIVGRGDDNCYRAKWLIREDDGTKRQNVTACLAKIGDELYLDYTDVDWNEKDDIPFHDLTSHLHQVARVRFDDGRMILHTIGNDDWQVDMSLMGDLEARPFSDSDDFETDALLLESIGDLRKFLEIHGSNEAIWGTDPLVVLTRKH